MNLFADESVNAPLVKRLRGEGYSVLSVAELAPSISDIEVLDLANAHNALLLTADKDFGELVFRLKRITSGIVLLRFNELPLDEQADIVVGIFATHTTALLNAFTVITQKRLRIRPF